MYTIIDKQWLKGAKINILYEAPFKQKIAVYKNKFFSIV